MKIFDYLVAIIPRATRKRLGFKLLRSSAGEYRALTELFVNPYEQWAPWGSGIGDAHRILYALVRSIRPRTIVEIGSARGKSACSMALACFQNNVGKVYAIDPHTPNDWTEFNTEADTLRYFRAAVDNYELGKHCEIIQSTSLEASKTWQEPIDLLFIDGDHSFEGVKSDFEAFEPWLMRDALVVFHDTLWARNLDSYRFLPVMGVPHYVQSLMDAGFHCVTIGPLPGITIMSRQQGGFPLLPSPTGPFNGLTQKEMS